MAPLASLLTAKGLEMLDRLPPFLRDDPDTIAVIHCQAQESDILDGAMARVIAETNPLTATTWGLTAMEGVLGIPHDASADVETQRAAVLRAFRSADTDPGGVAWQTRIGRRIGNVPWTYEEHLASDGTSPAAQVLRVQLPFVPGSDQFIAAVRTFIAETPTELELVFVTSSGFILDVSEMDVEEMSI